MWAKFGRGGVAFPCTAGPSHEQYPRSFWTTPHTDFLNPYISGLSLMFFFFFFLFFLFFCSIIIY
jgi:hypothetical protein